MQLLRRLTLGAAILAMCAGLPATARNMDPHRPDVQVTPLPFNPEKPDESKVGRLTYLGGMKFTSSDRLFGGFSALEVTDNGTRLVATSDEGEFWTAAFVLKDGIPVGVTDNALSDLLDPEGNVLEKKYNRDSEGSALAGDGTLYVSFERNHRIMRYKPTRPGDWASLGEARPQRLPAPPELADLPANGGLEALAVIDDDTLFALSEAGRASPGYNRGWIVHLGSGKWEPFSYRRTEPFGPTDAETLPNGDMLVLERRFSILGGLGARLCVIAGATIKPGAMLECRTVAEMQPPQSIDNMEGLAVHRNEKGETLVYVISDDNFSAMQRTVLLVFRLEPEK